MLSSHGRIDDRASWQDWPQPASKKDRKKCDRSCLEPTRGANICTASGLIVLAYIPVFP